MKKQTVNKALPIVASAYGRKFGAKVVVGDCPSTAYTDGQTIVVPNISEKFPRSVLWGFLAHECAHVRFTDFRTAPSWGGAVKKSLINIVEDARIELDMMSSYPGVRGDLISVVNYMVDEDHFGKPEHDAGAAGALQYYCLYHLRYRVLQQHPLHEHFRLADAVLKKELPQGVQTRLKALLRKVSSLQSTAEVVALVEDILDMIKDEQDKAEQQQKADPSSSDAGDDADSDDDADSSSSDAGDDADSDDDADSSSSDAGDDADSDDDADSSSSDAGDDADSDDDADSSSSDAGDDADSDDDADSSSSDAGDDADSDDVADSSSSDAGDDADSDDVADAAKKLKDILDSGDEDAIEDVYNSLRGEMEGQAESSQAAPVIIPQPFESSLGNLVYSRQLFSEAKQTSNGLKAQLKGLVQASQRSASQVKRSGRRVDSTRLHRLATGDPRVFSHRASKQSPNTAVHVLVDMSYSMDVTANPPRDGSVGKKQYQIALESAVALGMALEAIPGVNPAITFFGGQHEYDSVKIGMRHGERFTPSVRKRFDVIPWGSTPMAEATWYAGSELAKTREERKLLMVLSDGEPNDLSSTQYAVEALSRHGVEMIGVGICHDAISHFIANSVKIDDVAELRNTMFSMIKKSLIAA